MARVDRFLRYRSILEAQSDRLPVVRALAEAASAARGSPEAEDLDPAVADVAAGAAAPSLVAFAGWCLALAEQRGARRAYFIAREGEVLLEIAEALRDATGVAARTELRYLHGSRGAWQLPAHAVGGEGIGWLLRDAQESTLRDLMARAGLEVDRHIEAVARLDREGIDAATPLGGSARRVAGRLAADPALRLLLHDEAVRRLPTTLRYLRQEGIFEDEGPLLFIDTGWIGRQMTALDRLIESQRPEIDRGYLLYGLLSGEGGEPRNTRVFAADARRRPSVEAEAARLGELLEMFCAGTEGTTVGYEERDGRVVPRLVAPSNEPAIAWGVLAYRRMVRTFAESFAVALRRAGGVPGVRDFEEAAPVLDELLRELWHRPSVAEARAWGGFVQADYGSDRWAPLAPVLGWSNLLPWVLNRRWIRWPYASAALAPVPLGITIRVLGRSLRALVALRGQIRAVRRRIRAGTNAKG